MTKLIMTAAALLVFAAPANAEPIQVHVSTVGLDLASSEGRAQLKDRAKLAARKDCGSRTSLDPTSRRFVSDCRKSVMEGVSRHLASMRLAQAGE